LVALQNYKKDIAEDN